MDDEDETPVQESLSKEIDLMASLKEKRLALLANDTSLKEAMESVARLENSNGCFICSLCSFSAWDGKEFQQHLGEVHPSAVEVYCVYCGATGPEKDAVKHQEKHLYKALSTATEKKPFGCGACPDWNGSWKEECLVSHIQAVHGTGEEELAEIQAGLTCIHCGTEFFNQFVTEHGPEALARHMAAHLCRLTHCMIPGCLVKSLDKRAVLQHQGKCHPGQGRNVKVTTELLCADKFKFVGRSLASSPSTTSCSAVGVPHVYCLKCPYCGFTTISWSKFVKHQVGCPRCPANCFRYFLFHCSQCLACSTERDIVEEHLLREHDKARLVQEELSLGVVDQGGSSTAPVSAHTGELPATSALKRALEAAGTGQRDEKRLRLSGETQVEATGANGDLPQTVSFPFDEDAFRAAAGTSTEAEEVVEKMRRFCAYQVRIMRKENHRRIPECPECGKEFPYGLGDFKRHLMTVHLDVPRDFLKECLKHTHLPRCDDRFNELQEELALKHMRPSVLDGGRRKIPLPYSPQVLRRLTEHFSREAQDYLSHKMKTYSNLHVILDTRNGKRYRCGSCTYASPHALADVRKHILGSHCGISTKHFRYCLQSSRLDPVEFTLLSDEKLVRLARDFMRSKKSTAAEPESSGSAASGMEPFEALSMSSLASMSGLSFPLTAFGASASPDDPKLESGDDGGDGGGGGSVESAEVRERPDSEEFIHLPFSETVLRQLTSVWLDPNQQDLLVAKMATYSTYQLVREVRDGKTVAYRCSCGRVFHTVRLPDKPVRPSTLADARRHVMGVHARIPHESLTVCCQASRISRENGWQLYSDSMLLQLAAEGRNGIGGSGTAAGVGGAAGGAAGPTDWPSMVPTASIKTEPMESDQVLVAGTGLNEEVLGGASELFSSGSWCIAPSNSSKPLTSKTGGNSANGANGSNHHSRLHYSDEGRVEKTIGLPYSLSALRVLTGPECDADTLEVLREKMDLYSCHQVLVTRQDNKRYFRCSGCNASSPHGMGDIRKHILGVHAKVPDRFKAACLHASRLTREDNQLLPDNLLLQLAKMKWKGTVGVDKNGLPTSPRARQQQILQEAMAGTGTAPGAKRNSQVPHNTHERPEVPARLFIIKSRGKLGDTMFSCSACRHSGRHIGAVRGHIVREHMNIPGHKCLICEELFPLKNDVLLHHQKEHPGAEFRLSQYSPYRFAMSRVLVRNSSSSAAKKLMLQNEATRGAPPPESTDNSQDDDDDNEEEAGPDDAEVDTEIVYPESMEEGEVAMAD